MTTRQKEVFQLPKDLEKLEMKLDKTVTQHRLEFRSSLETLGLDAGKMFEQVMLKMDLSSKGIGVEESGSSGTIELSSSLCWLRDTGDYLELWWNKLTRLMLRGLPPNTLSLSVLDLMAVTFMVGFLRLNSSLKLIKPKYKTWLG